MATTVTKTVKSAGGDYSSLSAWEAAQQGDLVAADELRQAECYGMGDTTAVTVDGSTTDATRYMRAFPAAGAEAQMPWDAGGTAYRLTATGTALQISDAYFRVERLQFESTSTTNAATAIGTQAASGVTGIRVVGCIGRIPSSSPASSPKVFAMNVASGQTHYWINCVAIKLGGTKGHGFLYSGAGTVYLYNATAADIPETGFTLSTAVVAKNCLATNCGTDFSGAGATGTNYNASEDTTAPGANSRINQTFTFVNAAGGDFHLASSDAGAKDFGTDLSGDANYPFATDFDGETRSGSWDIGADELALVTASGTSSTSAGAATTAAATPGKRSDSVGLVAIGATGAGAKGGSAASTGSGRAEASSSATPARSIASAAAAVASMGTSGSHGSSGGSSCSGTGGCSQAGQAGRAASCTASSAAAVMLTARKDAQRATSAGAAAIVATSGASARFAFSSASAAALATTTGTTGTIAGLTFEMTWTPRVAADVAAEPRASLAAAVDPRAAFAAGVTPRLDLVPTAEPRTSFATAWEPEP